MDSSGRPTSLCEALENSAAWSNRRAPGFGGLRRTWLLPAWPARPPPDIVALRLRDCALRRNHELADFNLLLSGVISAKMSMIPLSGLLLVSPVAIAGTGDIAQGRTLYLDYCASCHGFDADGHGPVAPALSTPPANLRLLSERYRNPLPADQIARFIDRRADVKAHGSRDMPVWGEEALKTPEAKGSKGRVRDCVAKLVAYLQSIQKTVQQASLK
jgi:Cytochrome C oxidase, cbb3-type, subunit III